MKKVNKEIFDILKSMFPNAKCELDYSTPFELLVAVILSAQCTDKRVNKVTSELFKKANTAEQFCDMSVEELEREIFSCGFYKNKAKAIKGMASEVLALGGVPDTQDNLVKLTGVGRKTANVVFSEAFHGDAIAVDTHVFRVANRLGLVNAKTPELTEQQLQQCFDKDLWSQLHHLLIFLGRYTCHSQKPDCKNCALKDYCKFYKTNEVK